MAKAASIPSQKNINDIIQSQIVTTEKIIDIVVSNAKKYSDYKKIISSINNYNKIINHVFGKNGIIESVSLLKNSNIKTNNSILKDIKHFFKNLENLINYISTKLAGNADILSNIDLAMFEITYLKVIISINNVLDIISNLKFNPFLSIKLLLVRLQFRKIKKFIDKLSEESSDILNGMYKCLSLLIKFTVLKEILGSLYSIFDYILNTKIRLLALRFKTRRIRKAIKILLKIIDLFDEKVFNFKNAIKASVTILMLLLIYKSVNNVINTIRDIKIGIKFRFKLFLLKRAINKLLSINNLIKDLTENNITKKDVKSVLFLLLSIKLVTRIFKIIRGSKAGIILYIKLLYFNTCINKISDIINTIKKIKIEKTILNKLNKLNLIFKKLNKIFTKIALILPIILLAKISLIFIIGFTKSLITFLNLFNKLLKYVDKNIKSCRKNLNKIILVFGSLLLVGAAILLFAIIVPLIVKSLVGSVLPFIGVLLLSLLIISGALLLAKLLTKIAAKSAVKIGINVLIIIGIFMFAAMLILVAGLVGQQMKEGDSIINILIGIAGIIAVSAVMVGLGIALSFAAPFIGMASLGIAPLVALLGLTLGAAIILVSLGSIKLDFGTYDKEKNEGTGIKGNIGKIINFTSFLSEQLKDFTRNDKKTIKRGKRLIRQVKKTVNQIKEVADSLNYIQNITLETDKILGNTSSIFTFIKELDIHIDKMLYGENATTKDKIISTITDFSVTGFIKRQIDRRKAKNVNKKLNKVEKVITTLRDIGDSLISINDLKINEVSGQITKNVEAIFGFVAQLDSKITTLLNAEKQTIDENNNVITTVLSPKELRKQARQERKNLKRANKKLNKVEKVITTLNNVSQTILSIKNFTLTEQEKNSISANIGLMFDTIDSINTIINTKINNSTVATEEDKLENFVNGLDTFSCSIETLSTIDSSNLKTNIDNYVKFVEKVNTIDVGKVETTSNMFRQMSMFSNSIKGDFDKLADSLSEKLLPVLTELKEIMSEVPDKLDVGFRNTSASIGAANAAPTRENVAAQVSRENPNLSKSDVDAIVTSRLNEKAKNEANGMSAKLDELISLLKGMSGENVVVKTL